MKRPLILLASAPAAAERLGFKRLGKRIRGAFASALTGLLRQNRLDSPAKRVKMRRTR